jgi:hypothetical protein
LAFIAGKTFFEHSGSREATMEISQGQRPWLSPERNSSREGRWKDWQWNRFPRPFRTHDFIERFWPCPGFVGRQSVSV